MNFDNLESLITAIKKDISDAEQLLEESEHQKLKTNEFFTKKIGLIHTSCSDDSLKTTSQTSTANGHL